MERIGGTDIPQECGDTMEASGVGDVSEDQTGEGLKARPVPGDVVHVGANYDGEEALEEEGYNHLLAVKVRLNSTARHALGRPTPTPLMSGFEASCASHHHISSPGGNSSGLSMGGLWEMISPTWGRNMYGNGGSKL